MADNSFLNIAMLGHKHMLSREGGVVIVVYHLSIGMSKRGQTVVCYDRKTHHVSGNTPLDTRWEAEGVKIVPGWSVEKKGLASITSSFSATIRAAKSSTNVIHIHAEGPAAEAGLSG